MAATAFPDRKKHHQAPRMGPSILLPHLGKRKRKGSVTEHSIRSLDVDGLTIALRLAVTSARLFYVFLIKQT
jgi:hypothetical protein